VELRRLAGMPVRKHRLVLLPAMVLKPRDDLFTRQPAG